MSVEKKKTSFLKKWVLYPILGAFVSFVLLLVVAVVSNNIKENRAETERQQLELTASNAGFESVWEYQRAQALSIETKDEYDNYLKKEKEKELAAVAAGKFSNVDEYREAKSVGIETKEFYDQYLAKKADELREQQEREAALAKQKRLAEEEEEEKRQMAMELRKKRENANCQINPSFATEKLSLSKCAAYINHINKAFQQPPSFDNGFKEFAWEMDQTCGYMSELQTADMHEDAGVISASAKIAAADLNSLKSTTNACNVLFEFHLPD